jgi:hypothetical protein
MRQHNGGNNGHLQLSRAYLEDRGWKSVGVVQRAKREILQRELAIKTRTGGLNMGPDLYAVTWLDISNYVGLEISSKNYHPGAWAALKPPPKKQKPHSPRENSTALSEGAVSSPAALSEGAKTAVFCDSTALSERNNECYHYPVPASGAGSE